MGEGWFRLVLRASCFVPPIVIAFLLTSCTHPFGLRYPAARWVIDDDDRPIARPAKPTPFLYPKDPPPSRGEQVEMLFELTARVAELPTAALPGGRVEAQNVNNFDEAPDSAWFTNRIGRRDLADAELVRGTAEVDLKRGEPLAAVAMGQTAIALWIAARDREGTEYLIAFDRAERPEMATGTGLIIGRILHAAGYNVPASSLAEIDPQQFSLLPAATFRDLSCATRPATAADLDAFFRGAARSKGGRTLRALITAKPPGTHLGPFSFQWRRRRDPNDRIAHQHRRELRGLDVLSAWVDNRLAIEGHTADFFVTDGGEKGHLVHYLIGFEAGLGNFDAARRALEPPPHPSTALRPVSMGLPPVTLYTREVLPAKGRSEAAFDAEHLNPFWWEPSVPNPAMWNATDRDELWGARLLSKFTDERIAALVEAGRFSDPSVRSGFISALTQRRDKILGFWFGRINPLGDFAVRTSADGAFMTFEDYAAAAGLPDTKGSIYRWRFKTANGRAVLVDWRDVPETSILLDEETIGRMRAGNFYALEVATLRPGARWPMPAVTVFLSMGDGDRLIIRGLARRDRR